MHGLPYEQFHLRYYKKRLEYRKPLGIIPCQRGGFFLKYFWIPS